MLILLFCTDLGSIQNIYGAWLVIDRDYWKESQLQPLHDWAESQPEYNFALSYPNFELWLLLHFEGTENIDTSADTANQSEDIRERLKEHIQNYNKQIEKVKSHLFNNVHKAIQRAENLDSPPCINWPRKTGTTVYKLMRRIFESATK